MPKTKTSPEASPPKPDAPEQPAAGDALGGRLREMFQAVEAAPVPDEITRLVETLEKKHRKPRRPDGGGH